MALHAAEDKTYPGASVASLSTPWGNVVDAANPGDGYHRVWARDLYQQASALLAAGDRAQATRMTQWLWSRQQITAWTQGDGIWYGPGSFPRYSTVAGVAGSTPQQLGCCEQLDEDAYPIVLADQLGLTDAATWAMVKLTADHITAVGPDTPGERWEEQGGKSPSTIAAEIAGLVCAADIARRNGDTAAAARYGSTADSWRDQLDGWTFTTTGYFGDHRYYERIEHSTDPNDTYARSLGDGTWWERDIVDGGFLDLVRLGVRPRTTGRSSSRCPNSTRPTRSAPPPGTCGTGTTTTRTARASPTAPAGPPGTPTVPAGSGRCCPANAASTPWPPAGRRRPTCRPWPTPPTPGT